MLHDKTILIIDDDPHIRDLVEGVFTQAGAKAIVARDGDVGLRLLYAHQPDLVILDILMPGKSGWDVCTQIRQLSDVPIIMLTSLDGEEDMVRAFDWGAVDYVTKPFSAKILLARSRAALRQLAERVSASTTVYNDGYLTIDLDARRVLVDGVPVNLTKTEYKILALLWRHAGQALTFEQILGHVWGPGYGDSVNYIHSYMSRLRGKLEPNSKDPQYLLTEHGVGYRFQPR